MKKLTILLAVFIIMIRPVFVNAQTPGDGWINLGDRLENNYKIQDMSDKPSYSKWNQEIVPEKNLALVSKLAFKKIDKELFQESKLHLKKINKVVGTEVIYDPQEIIVTNGFEIQIGNKKIKSKELPKNKEGWLIYDIEDPAVILSVTDLNNQYSWNSAILKNIFLYLDPEKNPVSKIEQAQQEASEKERQEFLKKLYTTPQEKGWTPVRTDNLENGAIVEHYDEGIRLYKKQNGDFMSFIQPEDTRDPKTLDVIKGMDQDFFTSPNKRTPVGAYQLTLPNGIIIAGNGVTGEIRFSNGSKLISDNDESLFIPIKLSNGLIALPAVFPISYDTFLEYETYKNHDERFMKLLITNRPDNIEILYDNKFSERFNPDLIDYKNYYGSKIKPLNFIYKEEGKSDRNFIFTWFNSNLLFYLPSDSIISQIFYPEQDGLKPFAIDDLIIPLEIETIVAEDHYNTIKFTNKDYIIWDSYWGIYQPKEVHLTLSDGTIIEKFPDFESFKITLPNGDKFVGEIEFKSFLYELELGSGDYKLKNGQLTTHDGKNYEYQNFINKTKRDAEVAKLAAAVQKALYSKYGKSDVDEALAGNIKTGMKLQMLKDLNVPLTLDDESSTYAWYKMATEITYHGNVKYRWIRVNKSTGKIDYIGSQRTGGFMSY